MPDFIAANGPIWGPDFVIVTVEQNGTQYALQVYPDANNPAAASRGLPTQYYWQPSQVYVAKRSDNPADYDFGMTLFKGLMTSDRDMGVTSADQEMGGGWLTFSTTFAVPAEVITAAISQLQSHDHTTPAQTIAQYFNYQNGDPAPLLGMIPISEDDVTINVPDLTKATPGMFIEAVSAKKGSIDAQGINTFLVTCNQGAAGAIASGLTAGGAPPFTVECDLHEQFWMDACTVTITADADKVYDSMSAALSDGGFLGITSASLQAAYRDMQTSGVIQTTIQMDPVRSPRPSRRGSSSTSTTCRPSSGTPPSRSSSTGTRPSPTRPVRRRRRRARSPASSGDIGIPEGGLPAGGADSDKPP